MASPLPRNYISAKPIGLPYQGTHTLYGNWESDNAVDWSAPVGTPIYAVADGTIGSQIGALKSGDPKLQGLRVHLKTKSNEFYYAHLSKLVVKAGQHVKAGQLLGYSGSANGVAHLHFGAEKGDPRTAWTPGYDQNAPPGRRPAPGQQPAAAPSYTPPDISGKLPPLPSLLPPLQPELVHAEIALPGSASHTLPGSDYAETWRTIASQPYASPEAQQLADLWGSIHA